MAADAWFYYDNTVALMRSLLFVAWQENTRKKDDDDREGRFGSFRSTRAKRATHDQPSFPGLTFARALSRLRVQDLLFSRFSSSSLQKSGPTTTVHMLSN